MALAVAIRFVFQDDKGKTSTTLIRVPTTFSISQYTEFAQAAAQLLTNASSAAITKVSVTFNVDLVPAGLKAAAAAVSKVARKLFIQFTTAVTGFLGKTIFPGLLESKVVSGSDDVDEADVDVAALISAYEDGIVVVGGTMTFTNGRGHDIVGVSEAKEQFRRRSPS